MCPAPLDPPGRAVAPDRPGPPDPVPALPPVLVSACLLGVCCNHRGAASASPAVAALAVEHRLIPVCPEVSGGLATPRVAAERQAGGQVITAEGEDVTDAYRRGAEHAVRLASATGAAVAVLKARSPSCGSAAIYDGSFTRTLVAGEGVTAEALRQAGVAVGSEDDIGPDGTIGALRGA